MKAKTNSTQVLHHVSSKWCGYTYFTNGIPWKPSLFQALGAHDEQAQ